MDLAAGLASGVVGALLGVPAASVAFAVRGEGQVRLPRSWWRGGDARPAALAAIAAAAGLACGIVGARVGWRSALPAFVWSAAVGIVLAVIDVRVRRLPFALTVSMYSVCVICLAVAPALAGDYRPAVRTAVAGGAALVGFLMLALALPGQLGLGDVVLAGWVSMSLAWFGWRQAYLGLLAALLLHLLVVAVIGATRRSDGVDRLPLGPAMLAGWLVTVAVAGS